MAPGSGSGSAQRWNSHGPFAPFRTAMRPSTFPPGRMRRASKKGGVGGGWLTGGYHTTVRFGVNVNWADLPGLVPRARAIGLDYVELRVSDALSPLTIDEQTFRERLAALGKLDLPVEAANVFLTPPVMVVGPDAELDRLREYARVAVERLRLVGAEVVVWGSGPTRQISEGFPRERAWAQMRERVGVVAELGERAGIRIA